MLGNEYILYDMDAVPKLDVISFDPRNLAERQALVGEVCGRGPTYFIRIEQQDWVLRHYQRGGVVAGFVQDSYVWIGLHRTRPWREWHMLQKLYSWQLPVPRPVAARASRHGLFYTGEVEGNWRLHSPFSRCRCVSSRHNIKQYFVRKW